MSVPGHLRLAVRRHQHLADLTIALAVFAATLSTAFAGHGVAAGAGSHGAPAIAAAAVACGALIARRRHPLPALAVSAVAAESFVAVTGGTGGSLVLLAPSIALFAVADQVERRRDLLIAVCALLALVLAHAVVHNPALFGPQNLALTALGGLAIAAGDSSRNRRAYLAEVEQRAKHAEGERERDARRQVAEERLRIARDLHDSVGHHLALISVQSDVAGQAIERDAAAAREALAHVKSASRKALTELRDTIGLLRRPGDPVAPTDTPTPGLDALDSLLDSLRASGLGIETLVDGDAVPLPPAVDVTAYRVIQESLTNVYKHSDDRKARLLLSYDRLELRITVDDLGRTTGTRRNPAQDAGTAHGIVGMNERVHALGGRLAAGPRPESAFQVIAALPYQTPELDESTP